MVPLKIPLKQYHDRSTEYRAPLKEYFRKGLDQLIRSAAAGLVHAYLEMEDMFMRKGPNQEDEFVFHTEWTQFLPSAPEHWTQIDRRHYRQLDTFLDIMEDAVPGKFSRYRVKAFFKQSVKKLRRRMRASHVLPILASLLNGR